METSNLGRSNLIGDRVQWLSLNPTHHPIDRGHDVVQGLYQTPKSLPCQYFYDERGSLLFEQICTLPEYYPTRTERGILEACATEIATLTQAQALVELGSGSSSKTRLLLDALSQLHPGLWYYPIDVSGGILKTSALEILQDYSQVQICGLVGTYEEALARMAQMQTLPLSTEFAELNGHRRRLLIFLGSTIGNLEPVAYHHFLNQVEQALTPGDFFLLGVDLQKSPAILEPAYNDSQGITAQFNLNILQHLNWRFQGNFDLTQFQHWAFYNSEQHQIEIYLKSQADQMVHLQALDLQVRLRVDEMILTEISRKFDLPTLQADLETHNLQPIRTWTDPQQWFGLVLCQR
jgi:L-histidine Nalpha-methyltransferase